MPIENNYLIFECDMGSGAVLRIFKEDDGDIIVSIYDPTILVRIDSEHKVYEGATASVQFCTPFTGGGRHPRLWKALIKFFLKEMTDAKKDDPRQYTLALRAEQIK